MELASFLTILLERGVARVGTGFFATPARDADAERIVEDMDFFARANCPGTAPPLDVKAAVWAAALLYRACQFLHARELDMDIIAPAMREPCPCPPELPATIYSVDLTLRYLPDVLRIAAKLAEDDPFLPLLHALARDWPLSGVGCATITPAAADAGAPAARSLDAVLGNAALAALYRDRIITWNDKARLLDDARVRSLVSAALGGHPELAPDLARALAPAAEAPA
ncbi:hypothetical protein DB346_18850 [Verrucomicrobia bacterium LW23]|nr:hypothetical protein DB346_18850 [Verrucomicrobia bacterium LW23]